MSGNANIYPYFTFPKRQIGGTQIFSYMTHKSICPWLFVLSGIITTLHFYLPEQIFLTQQLDKETHFVWSSHHVGVVI